MRLINYAFASKYTNESSRRIFKTTTIQQDNLSTNSCPDFRIGGVFFVWGMTQGLLDPAFAIPAGVGDILIGVTAIPFAIFLWKGYSWSKYALIVWSVLGIADLVNALTLGQITSAGPSISTVLNFPLILFPTMPMLAALALHLITLYRLRHYVPIQAYQKLPEA